MIIGGVARDTFPINEGSNLFVNSKLGKSRSTLCIYDKSYSSQTSLCHQLPSNLNTPNGKRIIFNISGHRYETWERTLSTFPDTLLGSVTKRLKFYRASSNEYILNRDKDSFDAILFYYQSRGILSRPYNVDRRTFELELQFFEISDAFDRRNRFEKDLEIELEQRTPLPDGIIRRRLWMTFEYPQSSKLAKYLGYFSFFVIALSVFGLCAETIPSLEITPDIISHNVTVNNSWRIISITKEKPDYWFMSECVSISWFTFEYIIRLYSAPSLRDFALSALGVIDFSTIVPFYIGIILKESKISGVGATFGIFRILRLLRLSRIFKLTRYNEGLKVVIMTVYQSMPHFRSIFVIIIIMSVFFATLIFYAENLSNPTTDFFISIPDSIWYALITQTSVGYGDIYPQTTAGKFIGGMTAVSGVLLFCLPAPVLVNKFIECYYLRQKLSEDDDPQRKAFLNSMKEIYFQ